MLFSYHYHLRLKNFGSSFWDFCLIDSTKSCKSFIIFFIYFKIFSYSFCFGLEDFKISRVIHELNQVLKFALIFNFWNAILQRLLNISKNVLQAPFGFLIVFENPRSTLSTFSLRESVKSFISRFITNTGSWLKKIRKWSEKSTFNILVSILLSKEFARIWSKIVVLRFVTRAD